MKFSALALPFVVLMDIVVFVSFIMWQHESVYEFEQRQLDLQVNYAIDAATQEMLENSSHLSTDYADWGSMVVEPEVALDTYLAVLVRNFGWGDTVKTREELLDTSIPFFTVATYDGYYIYCKQKDTETIDGVTQDVYTQKWTPKIPYSEVVKNGSNWIYYMYNLGDDTYGTYNGTVLKLDNKIGTGQNAGSYNRSRVVIAEALTDACTTAMYSALEGKTTVEWIIPASYSEWSNSRSIERPSVLTYISRYDKSVMYDTVTFGIGGAKVDDANFCILYKDAAGNKLYTYAENRALVENAPTANPAGKGYKILSIVPTPQDAANKGYYFDMTLLNN